MQDLAPVPRPARFSRHQVNEDCFRVARWSTGSAFKARPLLFFSGIGANIELLAPFLEQIRGRDVVTLDVLGLGGSSQSLRPYRLSKMADAAATIMSQLDYDEIDVMGVSWGGMLAQEFAYRHRARVHRLVLAATSAGLPMIPGNPLSLLKMILPHRYEAAGAMEIYLQQLYGGSAHGLEGYAARIRPPTPQGYLHQLLAIVGWTSFRKLTCVSAEALVLMGADDRLVPAANGQILEFLLENARLEVLEDAGHLFLLSHLAESCAKVETFLDAPSCVLRPASPGAALTNDRALGLAGL